MFDWRFAQGKKKDKCEANMIDIRKAKESDVPSIRSIAHSGIEECIEKSCGDLIHIDSYFENDGYVKNAIDDLNSIVLVASRGEMIVGWALAFIQSQPENAPFYRKFKRVYIDSLDVVREERGCGIGRNIIEEIERWAKANGQNEIVLDVYAGNDNAKRLYDGIGYKIIKETRRKYI